ncbi:MAG: ECF RNA polymerase sigma factor SigK [Terrimesophilobacter sp.]
MTAETEGEPADAGVASVSLDALLQQVAQGDQPAFSDLYDRIAPRVLGLVRRVLIDHAQSEEVTQEVFLEIWQSASRVEPNKGKAMTWILTMARRRAIDRIRSSQAGRDRDTRVGLRDYEPEYDEVAESVEIRVEAEKVDSAMRELSDVQRQVISLAYYGGNSHSEIAQTLGVPICTVKTRMRDGMIRLRNLMGVAL